VKLTSNAGRSSIWEECRQLSAVATAAATLAVGVTLGGV
jgi:hypothetical protein